MLMIGTPKLQRSSYKKDGVELSSRHRHVCDAPKDYDDENKKWDILHIG